MDKRVNFIILSANAYGAYETSDMAGSMRIKNLFNPLLSRKEITVSNLVMLDLLGIQYNDHNQSTVPGVDCLSIGYHSIKNPISVLKFLNKGMKFIRNHQKKDAVNIIYNYQYPDIRNFLLILYAKIKGFKVVFDLVEDKRHDKAVTLNDKINKRLSLWLLKNIRFVANIVFVISSHLEKEIGKITGTKVPVFLLPISVDFKNIDGNKQQIENDPIEIFYGGSFAPKDGLVYLLNAVDQLKNTGYRFKLILSGKAMPENLEKVLNQIKDNPGVEYKGFLTTEEYFKLLGSVNICCMTRNNSAFANAGFPFKLGEFLAAGKVIIASRIGDVEKYLTHKESAYLVTPESTQEIYEGLVYCLENYTTLKQTMGVNARQVAEQHFDAKVSSRFMLDKCIGIA